MRVYCHFCKQATDDNAPGVYRRVAGWAKKRAKGVNAIALRVETGEYCCSDCFYLVSRGIEAEQMNLFEAS